jgi:putative FmdB family regulatory protein
MPLYEYRCEPCDHSFETLVRSSGDVPRCPRCGGVELAKQFSVPAAAHAGRPPSLPVASPSGGGCGAPQCGGGFCAGMG